MKFPVWLGAPALLISCSSLTSFPESELKSDYYYYSENKSKLEKVYVDVKEDSTTICKMEGRVIIPNHPNQKFIKRTFDIDVLVVPFKLRPATPSLPRQLTTNFNGSVFLGYRVDRYKSHYFKTPLGTIKQFRQRGITIGAFGGIGTASVAPWTTNYKITDEYNGFILNRGLAAMFGINDLTVGVGVGWDYLTDRDKDIWIYQNKAWYGVTMSLHLN